MTLARVAAVLAAALAAVAGVLLLGRAGSAPSTEPSAAVAVRTSLSPDTALFGDRVTAHVVVLLDRRKVEPGSLRLVEDVAPLTMLGPSVVTRARRGPLEIVSYEIPGACLDERCLSETGDRTLVLPAARVEVALRGGGSARGSGAWPPLRVTGRVQPRDLAPATPAFRGDTSPVPRDYRISPSSLALLLEVLAGVLAVAGLALVAREAAGLARRRPATPAVGGLERAVRFAREAEARPAPDRRRAAGLVARLLGDRDRDLAGSASDLAWSRPAPEGAAVSELADEVERKVLR